MIKYLSKGPDDTKEIGYRLGRLLQPGDVVGLYGELGTGKTIMVKGVARAFGIDEREIVSASFTIISGYDTIPPFIHIDLYRIEEPEEPELDALGLWEYIGGDCIAVIEWAEKAERWLPEDSIKVTFNPIGELIREITIEGIDEKDWNNL
ncbi:MAG: tRNA (adenosine(37)-N6)-threonylcarbamoyltransferase complex ATPase subunit type 1 TsaE [Nitrospira sp.]|nr:tRNA (adenosine(37)-N6)-threonylcarbamoyltransferase complex ATPase subunit type 1 TsaE [Nitrospira sp.]